jgi:hypothetical protein
VDQICTVLWLSDSAACTVSAAAAWFAFSAGVLQDVSGFSEQMLLSALAFWHDYECMREKDYNTFKLAVTCSSPGDPVNMRDRRYNLHDDFRKTTKLDN